MLTKDEFSLLGTESKLNFLWVEGVLVGERNILNMTRVRLFYLYDFAVELFESLQDSNLSFLSASNVEDIVDLYVEDLDLATC